MSRRSSFTELLFVFLTFHSCCLCASLSYSPCLFRRVELGLIKASIATLYSATPSNAHRPIRPQLVHPSSGRFAPERRPSIQDVLAASTSQHTPTARRLAIIKPARSDINTTSCLAWYYLYLIRARVKSSTGHVFSLTLLYFSDTTFNVRLACLSVVLQSSFSRSMIML